MVICPATSKCDRTQSVRVDGHISQVFSKHGVRQSMLTSRFPILRPPLTISAQYPCKTLPSPDVQIKRRDIPLWYWGECVVNVTLLTFWRGDSARLHKVDGCTCLPYLSDCLRPVAWHGADTIQNMQSACTRTCQVGTRCRKRCTASPAPWYIYSRQLSDHTHVLCSAYIDTTRRQHYDSCTGYLSEGENSF